MSLHTLAVALYSHLQKALLGTTTLHMKLRCPSRIGIFEHCFSLTLECGDQVLEPLKLLLWQPAPSANHIQCNAQEGEFNGPAFCLVRHQGEP